MKKTNVIWGLLFLAAAVLLILSGLDIFENFNFFKIFVSLLLIIWFVYSLFKLNFYGILFPVAFLCILYDEYLGIEKLTPWPVLIAALLGSIGLSLIFKTGSGCNCYNTKTLSGNSQKTVRNDFESIYENQFSCNTLFGSDEKYIKSKNLTQAYIRCNFGESKIFFIDAVPQDSDCTIILDVHFADVTLYLPKTWNVINRASAVFGTVREINSNCSSGTPSVYLNGDVAFGSAKIIYE